MNRNHKLIEKFKISPEKCTFQEIEKILIMLGFNKVQGKGSHVKMFQKNVTIIFSPHNHEIKPYQKRKALKACQKLNLLT